VTWDCRKHGVAWGGGRRAPGWTARARAPARGRPQGHENKKPMQCMKNIAMCQMKLDAACFKSK